ncbi:MAG TPA: hypothetical protein VKZ81_19810 [Pseudonocardia sp.]|jgi:pyridoxamine 5'-phosphate oxidase family protein|uniref:hypothetical protein n=1 Tax=Pseudonocardia sp. TaxID=60912 RepID=UPI002B4B6EBC|nr:hypothetical protein [Pseudonocardia sp.]HLU57707.1 hypothetical protein [Pseudonocardia sp.]
MSTFTAAEIDHLRGRQLARIATAGPDGRRVGASFDFDPAWILVRPSRIASWGIDGSSYEVVGRSAEAVG